MIAKCRRFFYRNFGVMNYQNLAIVVACITTTSVIPMIAVKKKEEETHCHNEAEKDCCYDVQSFSLYAATSTTSTSTTTTTTQF